MTKVQTYKSEDLDFTTATQTISSAQKFVIPVPAFREEGEPLTYPAGTENAGKPIVDYKGEPIGDKGIVFFNGKDKSWQAAPGDGQSVIILNGVSEAQAAKIVKKIDEASVDPNGLTVTELKSVLDYVRDTLGITDMYNSDKGFIASKMNALETSKTGIEAYGLHKRDDRDICLAVHLSGAGQFQGPAATPQRFENGAIILKQGDSVRLVQPEIFERDYRHANGNKLKVSEVVEAKVSAPKGRAKQSKFSPK